jgi:TubC N-terminal docking domain
MEGSVMSAANLIRDAARTGVWVGLDGDKLALRAPVKPPDALLAKLKANKPEIIALLRHAACAVRPAGYSDAEWLAAVADADRLGYPPREAAQ